MQITTDPGNSSFSGEERMVQENTGGKWVSYRVVSSCSSFKESCWEAMEESWGQGRIVFSNHPAASSSQHLRSGWGQGPEEGKFTTHENRAKVLRKGGDPRAGCSHSWDHSLASSRWPRKAFWRWCVIQTKGDDWFFRIQVLLIDYIYFLCLLGTFGYY